MFWLPSINLYVNILIDNEYQAASILLANGASPDVTDFHGATPAHIASAAGNIDAVGSLLTVRLRLVRERILFTEFFNTADDKNKKTVIRFIQFDMLMYYKADVCAIDNAGRSPLDCAAEQGRLMASFMHLFTVNSETLDTSFHWKIYFSYHYRWWRRYWKVDCPLVFFGNLLRVTVHLLFISQQEWGTFRWFERILV